MAEYIDRQAALDELDEDIAEFVECDYALKTARRHIEKIPPVDVRPVVRGRWRKIGNNSDGTSDYECSACLGIIMNVPDDDKHPMVSFCSMCGADMRGGDVE